jgi:hypothetical protein
MQRSGSSRLGEVGDDPVDLGTGEPCELLLVGGGIVYAEWLPATWMRS